MSLYDNAKARRERRYAGRKDIAKVFTAISLRIGSEPSAPDDNRTDRLSNLVTATIMIIFAAVVLTKGLVGEPISCWVPKHFEDSHENYVNNLCWVSNTYYLPVDANIPKEHESNKRHIVAYYQWVPLILLLQALFFYLPRMFWRRMVSCSGIDIGDIIDAGSTFTEPDEAELRERTLRWMTLQVDRFLSSKLPAYPRLYYPQNTGKLAACSCSITNSPSFLTGAYLITKTMYMINAAGQLFLLQAFIGTDFHLYGVDVVHAIVAGNNWSDSKRFPSTTMCDFKIRRLGNIHRYTVQCVLPINHFNERIFLFIWFWLVFVFLITTISLLTWIVRHCVHYYRASYIKKYLRCGNLIRTDTDRKNVRRFVDEYLRQDGVLLMQLVEQNTDGITITELVHSLWDNYCAKQNLDTARRFSQDNIL